MHKVFIYEAIAARDCAYGSGRVFLKEGEACKLHVGFTTMWVQNEWAQPGDMAFCTQDPEWVWENLFVELPWEDQFLGGKEEHNGEEKTG